MNKNYPIESLKEHPPNNFPGYASTIKRTPRKPLVLLPPSLSDTTGPMFGHDTLQPNDNDLTRQHEGEPLGERIIVHGRVVDEAGRPVKAALVEVWQCNSTGRYRHDVDQHPAPLDPNFTGCGRMITDEEGRYRFVTIKPGAYPWRNHYNAWRPAHIHYSIFGAGLLSRLVTQMYFPGDPLFAFDPIYNSAPNERARQRMVASFDLDTTEENWALGYRWDIVLRGRDQVQPEPKHA